MSKYNNLENRKFLINENDIHLFKVNYSNSKIKILRKIGKEIKLNNNDNDNKTITHLFRIEYKNKLYEITLTDNTSGKKQIVIKPVEDEYLDYLIFKKIEDEKIDVIYRIFRFFYLKDYDNNNEIYDNNQNHHYTILTELNMLFNSIIFDNKIIYQYLTIQKFRNHKVNFAQINDLQCKYLFRTSCKILKNHIHDYIYKFENDFKKEKNHDKKIYVNKYVIDEIVKVGDIIVQIKNIIRHDSINNSPNNNSLNNNASKKPSIFDYEVEIYKRENQKNEIKLLKTPPIFNENEIIDYPKFRKDDVIKTIIPVNLKNYEYGVIQKMYNKNLKEYKGKKYCYDVKFYVKDKIFLEKEIPEDKLEFYFNLSKGDVVCVIDDKGKIAINNKKGLIGRIDDIKFGEYSFSDNLYTILDDENMKLDGDNLNNLKTCKSYNPKDLENEKRESNGGKCSDPDPDKKFYRYNNDFHPALIPLPKFHKNDNVKRVKVNKKMSNKFDQGYLDNGIIKSDWFDDPSMNVTFENGTDTGPTKMSYKPIWLYNVKFSNIDYSKLSSGNPSDYTENIPEDNLELYHINNFNTSSGNNINVVKFNDGYYITLSGYEEKYYDELNNFICKNFSCLNKINYLYEKNNVNEENKYRNNNINTNILNEFILDYNVEDYNFTRDNLNICNQDLLHYRNIFKCSNNYKVVIKLYNEYLDITNKIDEQDLIKRIIFLKGDIIENFKNLNFIFKKNFISFKSNDINTIKQILSNLKHNTKIYDDKIFHVEIFNDNGVKMIDEQKRLEDKYNRDEQSIKNKQTQICNQISEELKLEIKQLEIKQLELELEEINENKNLTLNIDEVNEKIEKLQSQINKITEKCSNIKNQHKQSTSQNRTYEHTHVSGLGSAGSGSGAAGSGAAGSGAGAGAAGSGSGAAGSGSGAAGAPAAPAAGAPAARALAARAPAAGAPAAGAPAAGAPAAPAAGAQAAPVAGARARTRAITSSTLGSGKKSSTKKSTKKSTKNSTKKQAKKQAKNPVKTQ